MEMMRYAVVIAAVIAAACTVPPMTPPEEPRLETLRESPVIEVVAPREDPAPPPVRKPVKGKSSCAGIDTGDPVGDARAKLDCIEKHIR